MRFRRKPEGLQGLAEIGRGLGTLDREVFEAVAESPSPLLDATMPRLSWAADPKADGRRGPARGRQPRRHEPGHQPVRQTRLEAAATQHGPGATGPTES